MKWISKFACFVLCGLILAACYQSVQTKDIENMYQDLSLSNTTQYKKGFGQLNTNHLKNLEAEMLEEVFCYSPRLGGGAYFLIPTARMQNFGYVDLQPSDVVSGGGGGTSADLMMAQLSGPVPMISTQGVKNPCLKATLDMVLHNTDILNQMSQLLQNFGEKTNIKIVFEENPYSIESNILGEFKNTNMQNSYKIILDSNTLPHYSKEVIVSIIYHEVLHAQMEFLFKQKEESKDHERMATQYLQIAVNSLRNQFTEMDDFSAKSLVFSGLKKTIIYNTDNGLEMNPGVRYNMSLIESKYKNGNKGKYCDF
jgi:hypothetical protein